MERLALDLIVRYNPLISIGEMGDRGEGVYVGVQLRFFGSKMFYYSLSGLLLWISGYVKVVHSFMFNSYYCFG